MVTRYACSYFAAASNKWEMKNFKREKEKTKITLQSIDMGSNEQRNWIAVVIFIYYFALIIQHSMGTEIINNIAFPGFVFYFAISLLHVCFIVG